MLWECRLCCCICVERCPQLLFEEPIPQPNWSRGNLDNPQSSGVSCRDLLAVLLPLLGDTFEAPLLRDSFDDIETESVRYRTQHLKDSERLSSMLNRLQSGSDLSFGGPYAGEGIEDAWAMLTGVWPRVFIDEPRYYTVGCSIHGICNTWDF